METDEYGHPMHKPYVKHPKCHISHAHIGHTIKVLKDGATTAVQEWCSGMGMEPPMTTNAEAMTKKDAPELAVRLDAVDMKGGLILVDTDGVRHPVEGVTDIDLNFTPGELPTVRVEFKLTKGIKFL